MLTKELIELINKDRKDCLSFYQNPQGPYGYLHCIYKDDIQVGYFETAAYKDNTLTLFQVLINEAYLYKYIEEVDIIFNFGENSYKLESISFKPYNGLPSIFPGRKVGYFEIESLPITN